MIIDTSPMPSWINNPGSTESITFVQTWENSSIFDSFEEISFTDTENGHSHDNNMFDDHLVSCSSFTDEFKIFCSTTVDHSRASYYGLHEIWKRLTYLEGKNHCIMLFKLSPNKGLPMMNSFLSM